MIMHVIGGEADRVWLIPLILSLVQMSHSAEELQNLRQGIKLKSLPQEYSAKQCSKSTTPGRFCDPCMQLKAADAKLYAHFEEMNKLLKIQAEAKERVNQHHDLLSHLPVEISSHIFAIYTEEVNSEFNPLSLRVKHGGPLLLGAVSKFWRQVAFSTPHLWNTVNIHILPNDNLRTKAELTKEWLARSRGLPLHLSLGCPTWEVVELGLNRLIPLFNELQHVSRRWRMLFLAISARLYPTFLGKVICASTLETLKLTHPSEEQAYFLLPHTPLLKDLDIAVSVPFRWICINWSGLTTIVAYDILIGEYFDILQLSEGLESFRLNGIMGNQEYRLPTTPLTHSALRELYLETNDDVDSSELVTMLDLVTFPSLKKFGYNSGSRTSFPNSAIPSIFNRSRCQLTHFDLCGDLRNGTTDDLISILSDLPTITHFKLQESYFGSLDDALMSNMLLRRLTPILPSEFIHIDRLLPRLESLEFQGPKGFSWSCLASLVSATTVDGGPNLCATPERVECTNLIRRISFKVYPEEEMEHIDTQSLVHFQDAYRAGIFHCQILRGNVVGQVTDPFQSWGDDLS
jgi:hypothetical protein